MSDVPKKPVTETAMRDVKEELAALKDQLAKRNDRDSRQSKAIHALQSAKSGMDTTLDITSKYPVAAWIMGAGFVAGSLWWFDGVKLYIGCGVGVCFVPGLPKKVIGLFRAFKNGNNGNGSSTGMPTT